MYFSFKTLMFRISMRSHFDLAMAALLQPIIKHHFPSPSSLLVSQSSYNVPHKDLLRERKGVTPESPRVQT